MKNILFVDDHEVLARLSCEILEMQGYRAVSAYDGEDALRKFRHGGFDMVVRAAGDRSLQSLDHDVEIVEGAEFEQTHDAAAS